MKNEAVVVFTFKSIEHILGDGGTSWWHLKRSSARQCGFVVCTRNSKHPKVEGQETHASAFLVGKVKDVVPAPDRPNRYMIQFSQYARVSIPNVWKGDRNPVRYHTLEQLGIDPAKLKWEAMPEYDESSKPNLSGVRSRDAALTMAEAKRGLAITFGVHPEAIEITVRG